MKIKKTLSENKGAIIGLVSGLAIAGFSVCKALFSKNEPDYDDEDYDETAEDTEEETKSTDETPEEATDEPE